MKILKKLALLFVMSLPVLFTACKKDNNRTPKETILLESATIQTSGVNVGIRFNYDDQNRVTEAYEYFLNENPTTHKMDTSSYLKYTFDRSVSGVVTSKQYYYDNTSNRWDESANSFKTIHNGAKISKIEFYSSNTLYQTNALTWSGDKVTKIYNETTSTDEAAAKYSNGNYVDNDPIINEYESATSYTKNSSSSSTTFNSHKNYLDIVPVEYIFIGNFRSMMFPIGEYFSDNGISEITYTYKYEQFLADKTTKTYTATDTKTTKYAYTYGNLTNTYPTVVKQTITGSYKTEDFLNPSNNSDTPSNDEVIINLSLIKK